MHDSSPDIKRRSALLRATTGFVLLIAARATSSAGHAAKVLPPEPRWFDAAASMKRIAESWGDQPYGAVLVENGVIIGEGPSRVIKNGDPTAHAEREAIRDAQRRLGRSALPGSVLYSTSRPCRECEIAAARAQVTHMFFGPDLTDAGQPSL